MLISGLIPAMSDANAPIKNIGKLLLPSSFVMIRITRIQAGMPLQDSLSAEVQRPFGFSC